MLLLLSFAAMVFILTSQLFINDLPLHLCGSPCQAELRGCWPWLVCSFRSITAQIQTCNFQICASDVLDVIYNT